jgi:hypothetical protein
MVFDKSCISPMLVNSYDLPNGESTGLSDIFGIRFLVTYTAFGSL